MVEVHYQFDVTTGMLNIGPRLDDQTQYHYTSVASFMAIVESGIFRMTDSRFLNDPTEGVWLRQILSEVIAEVMTENGIKDEPSWWVDRDERDVYITSFSFDGDQLDQWRAYGDNGRGIAMGLAWGALPCSLGSSTDQDPWDDAFMDELPDDQRSDFLESAKLQQDLEHRQYMRRNPDAPRCDLPISILPVCYAGTDELGPAMTDQFTKVVTQPGDGIEWHMQNTLQRLDALVKSPQFMAEQEVRAVHTAIKGTAFERHYRESQNKIVPYIEMPWEVSRLAQVVIGPACSVTERELIRYLADSGAVNAEVVRSTTPYRST